MIDDLMDMCACGFVACSGPECITGRDWSKDNEENDPAFWEEG